MIKFTALITLLALNFHQTSAQKVTISGIVSDNSTGESLIGATVYNLRNASGATSNQYGFYSLTLAPDTVSIIFSFVGYTPQKITFPIQKDTTINVQLTISELTEVVVTGTDLIEDQTQMSTIGIPREAIKNLPALLGETDVLKVIQLLPGVQSGNEGSSGIYVRGGGPDQNLILLDGVPIYNASHLFGFFSVFNTDAINDVQLTKGGFPARYGGRLSSVIDITMKDGNKKELHGEGSIGLISSKLTLEGPIKKDKTSFIVSGRRTYLDLLARPILKQVADGNSSTGYYFYDVNAKVNHLLSNRDHLYASAYFGDDKAYAKNTYDYIQDNAEHTYDDEFGLGWGNIIGALRWNRVWNNRLFSNTTLTYSRYRFRIFQEYNEGYESPDSTGQQNFYNEYSSGIRDFAAKMDFEFLPNPEHYIRFGISATHHVFNPGVLRYEDTAEADTTMGSEKINAREFAIYGEDDIKVSERLNINAGLHFSGFHVGNEFYTSLQPRVGLRFKMGDNLSVKGSYAQMTQFVHLLTNSGLGLPTDLWVPATPDILPQQSSQVALGIAKSIQSKFEISLEGYYKKMKNLIEYKEGATYLNLDDDWQSKVTVGDGKSYGIEAFIQKKTGVFTGWLGYTLSWTTRQFAQLNFGKEFPYKYDRRNDVNLALSTALKPGIDFSLAWVFGTGNAITLPVSVYPKFEQSHRNTSYHHNIKHYESRNGYRMPSYHRMDINISFKKQKKWGERTWRVGAYNLYNRKNPFFIDLGRDSNEYKKFIQYSLFPIIPSVRYSFKF